MTLNEHLDICIDTGHYICQLKHNKLSQNLTANTDFRVNTLNNYPHSCTGIEMLQKFISKIYSIHYI